MLQIAVNDGGNGLADTVYARHQGTARDEADQQSGDAQNRNRCAQSIPESSLQRLKQSVVPADQQVVVAQNGDMDQRWLIACGSSIGARVPNARLRRPRRRTRSRSSR